MHVFEIKMGEFIELSLKERRSMETVLADLLAQYERSPSPNLTRTIELIRAEIELKNRAD